MKKPGLIIAAYPGMGQEIYTAIYDNYLQLSIHDYKRDNEDWAKKYAEDAVDLVTKTQCEVCFIDPHKKVLESLGELNHPFLIFYPGTKKEQLLKTLAIIYFRNPSVRTGKYLADVVLNFEEQIADLRLYPNSISLANSIVNEDFIKQILDMNNEERIKVIKALKVMKTTAQREKQKS